jgi:hypothetical protein
LIEELKKKGVKALVRKKEGILDGETIDIKFNFR